MRTEKLEERAAKLRADADALLKKSGLLGSLRHYGKAEPTGSYKLDLMTNPDIDIHVTDPKMSKEKAVKLLNFLIGEGFFNGYTLYDWTIKRYDWYRAKEGFPKGYYVGLKVPFSGERWKVDVWLLRAKDRSSSRVMRFVGSHLEPEDRLTILSLKEYRNKERIEMPSVRIYEAVLKYGVATPDELLRFLES